MKNILLLSLVVLLSVNTYAETAPTVQPAAVTSEAPTAAATAAVDVAPATTKKLSLKQKIQKYWNKISQFDFQTLNIVGKTEKFVAGKKKQNLESMEGVDTGVWKHTKRAPTSGAAKEIADKLDKTTQEKIKKYDSLNTY